MFAQQGGPVIGMKAGRQGCPQFVEGSRAVGRDGNFVVVQSADHRSMGKDGQGGEGFQDAIDPAAEIGLTAQLEPEEAMGKGIATGRSGEVAAEVVMREGGISYLYGGSQ